MNLYELTRWLPESATEGWLMLALFLAGSAGAFSLFARAFLGRPVAARPPSFPELSLGAWTPAWAAQLPVGEEAAADLKKELRAAGHYRPAALLEYAALRALLVFTPVVAAGLLALLAEPEQLPGILIAGAVAALLGFSVPRAVLYLQGRQRLARIEAGLPIAVDLLTLGLSAGQNLLAATARVSRELRPCNPVLADELEIVREQAALRSLAFALRQWADRVPSPEVRNLAMILTQAERLGTDTGAALLEWSSHLRTSARQKADARANQTMFWILFPTILCLWIPAAIMLIAPAVLEFQEQRRSTMKEWREARDRLRQENAPAPTAPAQVTLRE